tara:strand:- start:863 stop:2371 length:1509 start_codon:yes stop_codon:yes gene_type:complete
MYYTIYLYLFFSFLFSSNLYFQADPFYLFYHESEQFDTNEYDVDLNIRPAFKSEYDDQMSLSYNVWYYYNDNAPNLENTSNRWVARGNNLYNSIHFDYFNNYLYFSIEPYFFISENLVFNTQHTDPIFQALNERAAHSERPYIDGGLRETQLILHKNSIGIGLSNANMWWGSGIHNSLHMSNNTSGFNHFFLGTTSEKKIKSFGYNLKYIFSKLDKNIAEPYYTGLAGDVTYYGDQITTIGFFRSFLSGGSLSTDDISLTEAMLLPFESFFKQSLYEDNNNEDPSDQADQTFSLFISTLLPQYKLKLYFEIGWDDHRWDIYDFFQHPEHSSAKLLGFRKYGLFNNQNLIVGFEYADLVTGRYPNRLNSDKTSTWYGRNLFDYNLYDGRRFTAHSGTDSDDFLFYVGYLSDKNDIVISLNHERHGVYESVRLSNIEGFFHVPEYKIEFKVDMRKKYKNYDIYFMYEFEYLDNLGIPIQGINPRFDLPKRKSNVFGIGFSKTIK